MKKTDTLFNTENSLYFIVWTTNADVTFTSGIGVSLCCVLFAAMKGAHELFRLGGSLVYDGHINAMW